MKKLIVLSLIIGLMISACQNKTTQKEVSAGSADKEFTTWKETIFIDSLWATFPEWASSQGYHKHDAILHVPDEATKARAIGFTDWVDQKLQAIDFEKLSDLNKTDYSLLQNFVVSTRFYQNVFKENEWNPAIYNIGDALDYVINNNPAPLDEKLKNVGSRLATVPAYYEAAKKNINKPTREHTALAVKQGGGLLYFFDNVFPDSIKASKLSEAEKETFNKNAKAAREAITGYISWLKEKEKGFTKENTRPFAIGRELYEKKFAMDIASGSTAELMYQKAVDRKAGLHHEMYQISTELWKTYMKDKPMPKDTLGTIRAMIDAISVKHCHRDSFIATIQRQLPELVAYINEKKLITLDPTKPLVVRKTPEYMAGVAGASINNPGPYDKNGNTYYNVTPLTNYTAEEAESYLREYNDYVLQILNIHEAIPGHYVQLIYANRSPSIIKAIFGNGAMIEGWACYTERMMIESGYHKSPEMQLFYDKWNIRACCNYILDYNLQVNGWTEQQALDLMQREGFQQAAEAKEKYKRATLSQVQLASYFNGQTEILELRDEMKKKLGDKFDLRAFHEQFLSYGSAPVKEIRALMLK